MLRFTKTALFLLALTGLIRVDAQDINVTGGIFYVSGSVSANRLESHLAVENQNVNDLAVLMESDISDLNPAHATYYCWAQCYDTTITGTNESIVIPGQTVDSTSFHSYIYTHNTAGISRIRYKFFDQNNPADSSSATITYDVLNTGISAVERNLYQLSSPSPNPANNIANFSYAVPVANAKLIVRDLIGNVVAQYPLTSTKGVVIIPTTDLNSGIYLCSILSNGNSISSSKLVVSHR